MSSKLNLITYIITLFIFSFSFSQTSICLGEDVTVCAGSPVQINNCGNGGSIPGGNSIVLNNPSQVTLSDDVWSGVINIGFTFSFYGVNYTQCVIGSNGLISFNTGVANTGCAYALGGVGALPNAGFAAARNTAMLCYQDINPGTGGNIYYQTQGTSPNRTFTVLYANIPMFGSGECSYFGLILNESTNTIEYHIANKPISSTGWNGQLAIQGTENNAGSIAHTTPGRNNTVWTANLDGRQFTPTSPTNTTAYTHSVIPYKSIVNPSSSNFVWENTNGQTFPYNNGVLNIPSASNGTVGYFLTITSTSCDSQAGGLSDTSFVTGTNSSVSATSTPDICSSGIGTVTANPIAGMPPFIFNWPALGSSDQTVLNVSAGNYTVQMIDGMGCSSMANVTVGDTPASYSSATTIVSCFNGNDGTATATMIPELGNISYLWNDPLAQTTQTAIGLAAGTYTCTVSSDIGCSNDVSVTVTEIPQMIANFTTVTDATCNSGNDGVLTVSLTQGTPPYSYSWDNSTSTSPTANDLFAGNHTVTITDANGCIITHSGLIGEPNPLNISNLTPDTQICAEDEILLTVSGSGGSSPYLFTWYEDNVMIGTGTSITVDPDDSGTIYKVVLSEECNSPKDSANVVITFPTPIDPVYTPNHLVDCVVGEFEFTNNSINKEEIASTFIDFGDLNTTIELGYDSTSHDYTRVGTYTMSVIVTSIFGCIYEKTFEDIVTVQSVPDADFVFSANPSFSFDNSVTLTDQSTIDVIDWQWFAPSLSPISSNEENPTFNYPIDIEAMYPITLVVTSYLGCTDTVTLNLTVQDDILFYAPNTFTPNGDEFNNNWNVVVKGISVTNYNLMIFNRWGEMIFESNDPTIGWDGTYNGRMVETGTYVWKASMRKGNNDGKVEFNGFINLLK